MNPAESTAREMAVALRVKVFPCHSIKNDGTCSCGKKDCKDPGKHPLTMHGLSDATCDLEQIDAWATRWPKANWAAVPGDKYVVLDRDIYKDAGAASSAALEKKFPGLFDNTVAASTPRGGVHDWFELPPGEIVSSKNNAIGDGVDVKSRGGYVLLSGSRTDAGPYAWEERRSWKERAPDPVPRELLALLPRPGRKELKPRHRPFAQPLHDAMKRDPLDAYHKATGQAEFVTRGTEYYFVCSSHADTKPSARLNPGKGSWYCDVCDTGGGIGEAWAARFKLDPVTDFNRIERELAELFGVKLDEESASPKKSKVAVAMAALEGRGLELFRSSGGETFANYRAEGGHRDTSRISQLGRFITRLYLKETGDISLYPSAVAEIIATLDARAYDPAAPVRDPMLRYGGGDGKIYVNLGRPDRKILQITGDGLSVIEYSDCQETFLFPNGQLELPLPGKNPMTLSEISCRFFSNMQEPAFLLTFGFMLDAMRPAKDHHILATAEANGAGKTELGNSVKLLTDPATILSRPLSRDPKELFAFVRNSYVVVLDNCSSFSGDFSDKFASMSTGSDLVQRELYSDANEISTGGGHVFVFGGIPVVARKSDLNDRVMNPVLEEFTDANPGRDVADYRKDFMTARPDILATMWAAVSAGLRETAELPPGDVRMKSAAKWIYRCMKGLGKEREFMEAYLDDRRDNKNRIADESPIFVPVLSLVATIKEINSKGPPIIAYSSFNGTATALLNTLNAQQDLNDRPPGWPPTPWHLSTKLRELKAAFRAQGIIIVMGERDTKSHNRSRLIHIHHVDDPAHKKEPEQPDEVDVPAEHPREWMKEAM